MTKNEVSQKIKENGGSWIAEHQIVFTEDSASISAKSPDGMSGFLISQKEDWKEFHFANGFDLFDSQKMGEFIRFAKNLAEVLGVTCEIPGAETVERIVKIKDEKEADTLKGKVEAYENIVLGRTITIG